MVVFRKLTKFVALIAIIMIQETVKTRVIGVDISHEKTAVGVVDIRGNILATTQFATTEYEQVGNYLKVLGETICQLAEDNGGIELIRSVGISVPSGNYHTGCIENPPNLPWKGVTPLAAMLRDRIGIAVALANNAHTMGLAEQAFGAAHGMRDFIVVSLNSGVGSCIFSNGQAYRGADGFAGEVGHTCIVPGGRECGCGKRGCLETYCSAKGIVRTAKELMEQSDQPSLMRQVSELTPRDVTAFCEQGDPLAIETYRKAGYALGFGLANYASVLNPEAIIFSGGVSRAGKWLLEPANEAFESHVFHNIQGKVKFIVSLLDNHKREMLGASVLAWEVKEYSLFI